MTETISQHKALWTPGWYELDQTLVVGEQKRYSFFQSNPSQEEIGPLDEGVDLVFFNQLDSSTNSESRYMKILEILHPKLGLLARIDTDGVDYIFSPVDGNEIVVNAEEEPGTTSEDDLDVEDWSVVVTLMNVTPPCTDEVT